MRNLLVAILACAAASASITMAVSASDNDAPRIAKWYQNHDGAVSLRFDDTHESHITHAIPFLNSTGIKATFMVNPGTRRYLDRKDFWEHQVPAMGHHLGNHTMNHRGASDLQEAEYEIGEAARTIWSTNPRYSRLLVFASGGGETWGGKDWERAEGSYHQIAEKYHQIDLYDGKHPSRRVDAASKINELCSLLDKTADERRHQPFHFHNIGSTVVSSIKALVRGQDLTVSKKTLSEFLQCVSERRDRLWVAPLTDILKYEEEERGAELKLLKSAGRSTTLALTLRTDPDLFDHKLTMILPVKKGMTVEKVIQEQQEHYPYQRVPGSVLVDVMPVNSTITVSYRAM